MFHKRRLVSWLHSTTLAGVAFGLAGCSEELGPERMIVVRVKGVVKEGSRPVSAGWIEFFPVDGTVGNLCSARLHADGSFEAEHVPVGVNLIRLANASMRSDALRRVFGAYTSPIRRTIPSDPAEPIVIDVVDEAMRMRNPRAPATKSDSGRPGEAR
jgi:hypothetical protein